MQLQTSHATQAGRHYRTYYNLRWEVFPKPNPRILVFGCSTGEELADVRKVWPDADLLGCDIGEDVVNAAHQTRMADSVFYSSAANVRDRGPYDIIAANAVFCSHPAPENIVQEFPFSKFTDELSLLYESLKPGGLMLVTNSNYLVQDAGLDLSPIYTAREWINGYVPRFSPEGEKLMWSLPVYDRWHMNHYCVAPGFDALRYLRPTLFRQGPENIPDPLPIYLGKAPEIKKGVYRPFYIDRGKMRTTLVSDPLTNVWKIIGTHYSVHPFHKNPKWNRKGAVKRKVKSLATALSER